MVSLLCVCILPAHRAGLGPVLRLHAFRCAGLHAPRSYIDAGDVDEGSAGTDLT